MKGSTEVASAVVAVSDDDSEAHESELLELDIGTLEVARALKGKISP